MLISEPVAPEIYDVFQVSQLTRGTSLADLVAVDDVRIEANQRSQIHRHNHSDTVLYIVKGKGSVIVDEQEFSVKAGDRIHIPPGSYHGVVTKDESLDFISIQSPPILNKKTGKLDLEPK